ncbi:MAG: tetratricopeptide repeat protein [Steroidobacteraceae bacterium]
MRHLFYWQVSVLLLLTGMTAGAQVPSSSQNVPPSDNSPAASTTPPQSSGTPAAPETLKPGVTITGKPLHGERPLPKLSPDEFMKCYRMSAGFPEPGSGSIMAFVIPMSMCEHQRQWEEHTVIAECLYPDHAETLPRMVQACTETLGHDLVASDERYFVFAARAQAYFANGDPQHAVADYNAAIKLDPHEAKLYYDRGVVFATQSDADAALRDLDTAIGLDDKLVPALFLRAKLYAAQRNFSGALADYSQVIRLQPKNARFWSQRGSLCIRQRKYQSAIKDETQAIQLEPKLAPAYFLRADALASVGNRADAVSNLHTAVDLDPSLAHYVTITGKTVVLRLPPL